MIKSLRIICVSLILIAIGVVIYGRMTVDKHLDYEQFINKALYSYETDDFLAAGYPDTLPYLIDDDKVEELNYLIENSDYVLKVKVNNIEFKGKGIINNCVINKVFKGEGLQENDSISVYDHVVLISNDSILYIEGNSPMKKEDEYVIFINHAPNPNVKDSYMFSSVKYGKFRLKNEMKYLKNYENYTKTILEIAEYDHISANDDIMLYQKIQKQTMDKFR